MFGYPWERVRSRDRAMASESVADVEFSTQELAKLSALRAALPADGLGVEFGLDERRLRFAHWLVEHGILSEDL